MNKTNTSKKLSVTLKIVGLILSESYQKCKIFANKLRKSYKKKFTEPSVQGYLEMDWVEYLEKLRRELGGQTWAVKQHVVVFINGNFIGGEKELFEHFHLYQYILPSQERIKEIAKEEYLAYLNHKNLLYVFFELTLDDEYMGSLLFQLRPDLLPKTSAWFATVSDPKNSLGYTYKGSIIRRVCRSGWFQGGALGLAESAGFMEDESLCYKHDRRGVISLAKYGKDANRCQFFVTFNKAEWMDEYYVAFGRVVEGSDVLRRLEYTKCTYEHPDRTIKIDNCGLVEVGLGRQMVTKLRLKALTVGEPHLQLDTFMDLILDRFCEVLFERLDAEVKRQFHREWIGQMIWDMLQPSLMAREPIADYLDVNDRPSTFFDMANMLKGLYGLQEIPDHFIMNLLDQIIEDAVEMSDTKDMARSIVNSIIDSIDTERKSSGMIAAESFIKRLSKNVDDIILGSQPQVSKDFSASTISKKELFQKSIYKVVSQTRFVKKVLTWSKSDNSSLRKADGDVLSDRVSTKESVVNHVLGVLFELFKKSIPENENS